MFSFLKNWLNKDRGESRSLDELKQDIQEQSTVEAAELQEAEGEAPAAAQAPAERKKVRTELYLHPLWEQHLDAEKKYTLRFLQSELPEMTEGTVGVTGFSLIPVENGSTVAMFFRNATAHPARFKNVNLAIYLDDKPFARHRFDLSQLGAIPPYTSMPWEVFFPEATYLHENFTFTRWKVVMNFGKQVRIWPRHLDLDPEMEARLTERQKDKLESIVDALPPMKPHEVSITGFDIGKTQEGNLVIGLLFRSTLENEYAPAKLKLSITDAEGDLIAKGTIDASKVLVRPGTVRPWLVVIPAERVKKPDADLRKWYLEATED